MHLAHPLSRSTHVRDHRWIWWLAIAALAAIGISLYVAASMSRGTPPQLVLAQVQRRDIASRVTATGTLSPVVSVQVGSVVSGRIKELMVDYNSRVRAGQPIAVIDPQLFELNVEQARARLASARTELARAQAELVNARAEYQRVTRLADAGVTPRAEIDRARATMLSWRAQTHAARAGIVQAEVLLHQAEVNLEYTTIRSPIDGVVVSRNVDVGQAVAASLQAPTLFVIAEDLRKMEVHASVAESDVGQIRPGMRARFTVDTYPGEVFEGVVEQVRYEALTVANVVTYEAVIAVDNERLMLRPGMTANVDLVLQERKNAQVIPNRALRFRPRGQSASERRGERAIWIVRRGISRSVSIRIGITDGSDSEVLSGELRDGDLVILGVRGDAAGGPASRRRGPPRVF